LLCPQSSYVCLGKKGDTLACNRKRSVKEEGGKKVYKERLMGGKKRHRKRRKFVLDAINEESDRDNYLIKGRR